MQTNTPTHTLYLRMKPPLMAICSRSSTTRAPGWLFTTPSWFAPQAWPPPLILPHTHFSQGQCKCCIVCVRVYVGVHKCICACALVYLFVDITRTRCPVDVRVNICRSARVTLWVCVFVHWSVNVYMHVYVSPNFIAIHCQNIYRS